MWLKSDNIAGVDPDILAALAACNEGVADSYGNDALSLQLNERFSLLFDKNVNVFPVCSGTAANSLGLASIAGAFSIIACHENAHPMRNESGATTHFSGGAQFLPVTGAHGRIAASSIAKALDSLNSDSYGAMKPSCITVTQLTEAGTAYSTEQICEIGNLAHSRGLLLHMDGARFANAIAGRGADPSEMTWRAGVDVLSFGGTKNGTMYADALIFFDTDLSSEFKQRLKRAGHALSKARFLSAQLLRYLEADKWLNNANHANAMAQKIGKYVERLPSAELLHPVEGNIVFPVFTADQVNRLNAAGFFLRSKESLGDGRKIFRIVTSFQTDPSEVEKFLDVLGSSKNILA